MPAFRPRSLSKNQLKPHKDLRRKPKVSVFEISGKTLHCHVKQRRKLLFAIDLILGQAPRHWQDATPRRVYCQFGVSRSLTDCVTTGILTKIDEIKSQFERHKPRHLLHLQAERVGFEPTVRITVHGISSDAKKLCVYLS